MPNRKGRGVFATPRCPISMTSMLSARYLMRNAADAEDAVQECYLRALRHFDSYRGPAMKPWLLTILRNVCNAEFARRGQQETPADLNSDGPEADAPPMWQEPLATPEAAILRRQDDVTIRRLIADCRSRSGKPSCCARSTNCPTTRSPTSPAYRSAR